MKKNETVKTAFVKSVPILCSYLFVAMAYGIMMQEAGFAWYYSLFASLTIYTGAFQFVLITFLSSGASVATVAVTALLMNSRQAFYSLSFVDEFKKMGKREPYMIHTMTDETYAVNCALMAETTVQPIAQADGQSGVPLRGDSAAQTVAQIEQGRRDVMFFVALFSRCYWMVGAVAGGVIGQLIPFELKGIDFCMTALFVIIFIDQWEKARRHFPALSGLAVAVICLVLFGQTAFMLPALLIVSGLLLAAGQTEKGREE